MYEYFIDDVDAIRYQIDGDNLYLFGCEGDPNADFPDYYTMQRVCWATSATVPT
jgi:hypothetical protein